MALTIDDVRKVARLARLALTPEEERKFHEQLEHVLEHVEQLRELDLAGVAPTTHPTAAALEAAMREDFVAPSLGAERAVGQAPQKSGTSFAVPKILETS